MQKPSNQPLYEQVFERLKDSIRSGIYKKGDFLPSENELIKMMGVSRVTVRQALHMLSDAGIVETYRGKGSQVAVDWMELLNPGELRSHAEECWRQFSLSTQARRIIEPALARQAARVATEEDIRRLEQALENKPSVIVELPSYYVKEGQELQSFHGCLWAILRNPLLEQVWNSVVLPSNALRSLPLIMPVDQAVYTEEVVRQHRNILEAVRAHDGEYAYYHMLMHCDWIYETYKRYFKEFCR